MSAAGAQLDGRDTLAKVHLEWMDFHGGTGATADSLDADVLGFVLAATAPGGAPWPSTQALVADYRSRGRALAGAADPPAGLVLTRLVRVVGDTLGTMSLRLDEYRADPGAHPARVVHHVLRDVRDGRRLGFSDLFRASARESLSAVVRPYFLTARGLTAEDRLDSAGFWFPGGVFRVPDDFALTPAGIHWRFDPLEAGPAALGATDWVVPYAAIRTFAHPAGPLATRGE
jgi:hypothetical protein